MIGIGIAIPLSELRGGSLYPPLDNMTAWFKKGTAAGASWPNSSGGGSSLTLVGSPTIASGSVTFNGTTQYGNTSGGGYDFTSVCTVYMRVKQISWTAADTLFDTNSGAGGFDLKQSTGTPGVVMTAHGTGTSVQNTLPLGSFKSLAMGTTSGQTVVFFQVSGSAEANTGGPSPNGGTDFLVAANSALGAAANIAVTEIIIYATEHTAAQRAAVLAYLDTL